MVDTICFLVRNSGSLEQKSELLNKLQQIKQYIMYYRYNLNSMISKVKLHLPCSAHETPVAKLILIVVTLGLIVMVGVSMIAPS